METKTAIIYYIDGVKKDFDTVVYRGWCCAEDKSKTSSHSMYRALHIEALDSAGNILKEACAQTYREDVSNALQHTGIIVDNEFGFSVAVPNNKSRSYILRFTDERSGKTKEYRLWGEEADILEREKDRHFSGYGNMLRRYSREMMCDDFWYLSHRGPRSLAHVIKERIIKIPVYRTWRKKQLLSKKEKREQRETTFPYAPKISIVVPVYRTTGQYLREMIESVRTQTYSNWQLCIADGSAYEDTDLKKNTISRILKEYATKDTRIVYTTLNENRGISGNTNAALALAEGEYIALLDHDDTLEDTALFEVVSRLQEKAYDVLYTDEDKTDSSLKVYYEPYFKPDYSPDLLRSNNYICHFFIVKREIAEQVGAFRKKCDGAQDYDFILRSTEIASSVIHIPMALYHWRCHPGSTSVNQESKLYAYEAGRIAIEDHLARTGLSGEVKMLEQPGFYHVRYELSQEPLVSILIPNKDHKDILKRCVDSVRSRTDYQNYEIIIIENNSTEEDTFTYYRELEKDPRIKVIIWNAPFNYSGINNFGARQARGEYLLLLNNDTEVITPNWMREMLSDCVRENVGAVGAKLLYPNDTIQHAGVVIGLGGVAGHVFAGCKEKDPKAWYFGRALVRQNYSAVTAACLMVSAKEYKEIGGMDEELAVAFNDIDFCLRLRESGKQVVWNPAAVLYHYESLSRGVEDTVEKQERFERENELMHERWALYYDKGDPYYNPNLSLVVQDGPFALKGLDESK